MKEEKVTLFVPAIKSGHELRAGFVLTNETQEAKLEVLAMRHSETGQREFGRKCRRCMVYRRFFAVLLAIAASIFLSGCGVTLSPVKRAQVRISPVKFPLKANSQRIFVQFEGTLPNVPLADTVWDNIGGAFADPRGSEYIGYVQDYSKTAAAFNGDADADESEFWRLAPAVFGDMGGAAAAIAAGTRPDYTRIVIPFGRIFEGVFQSGVKNAFPNAIERLDGDEFSQLAAPAHGFIVSLRVIDFKIWEHPLNHINLEAAVECKLIGIGKKGASESDFEAEYQATNQAIGSVFSTSSGFIRNMNKVSNKFAADLSTELLGTLQKELQGQNPSALVKPESRAARSSVATPPRGE